MKDTKLKLGYIFIGLSIYFLFIQLNLSFLETFHAPFTMLGIIGLAYIIYSQTKNEPIYLTIGSFLVFTTLFVLFKENLPLWLDHWAFYLFLLSISLFLYYLQTKKLILLSIILILIALMILLENGYPQLFQPVSIAFEFINTFWPVLLLASGIYLLKK